MVLILIVASVALYGATGRVILRGYRWWQGSAQSARLRAFEGLKHHTEPNPGLVKVLFHTYHGVLVVVTQVEHRFWTPPEDAREALWRLHRFNLGWGMLAYGALLIPLAACGNYLARKRSIRKQSAAMLA